MSVVNTQIAYILHKRAYRETSSIIDVLTKDHGRVGLMSRGSRGARSKIAGNLLLFTPLVISWQGRGSLPYLKSIERADLKAPKLKNKSLLSAMYVNELLTYLLHKNDVQESIFEHYHHCLYALQDSENLQITLRQFEIKLLEILGFGLNLHANADTGEVFDADVMYHYYPDHGAIASRHDNSTGNAANVSQVSGYCLLALRDGDYELLAKSPQLLTELKHLLRSVIAHHLAGKQLKSRELFKPVGA